MFIILFHLLQWHKRIHVYFTYSGFQPKCQNVWDIYSKKCSKNPKIISNKCVKNPNKTYSFPTTSNKLSDINSRHFIWSTDTTSFTHISSVIRASQSGRSEKRRCYIDYMNTKKFDILYDHQIALPFSTTKTTVGKKCTETWIESEKHPQTFNKIVCRANR